MTPSASLIASMTSIAEVIAAVALAVLLLDAPPARDAAPHVLARELDELAVDARVAERPNTVSISWAVLPPFRAEPEPH